MYSYACGIYIVGKWQKGSGARKLWFCFDTYLDGMLRNMYRWYVLTHILTICFEICIDGMLRHIFWRYVSKYVSTYASTHVLTVFWNMYQQYALKYVLISCYPAFFFAPYFVICVLLNVCWYQRTTLGYCSLQTFVNYKNFSSCCKSNFTEYFFFTSSFTRCQHK